MKVLREVLRCLDCRDKFENFARPNGNKKVFCECCVERRKKEARKRWVNKRAKDAKKK